MENEQEEQIDSEEEEQETPEADLKDTTDWKAETMKARRIASRYRNQAIKAKEVKAEPTKPDAPPPTELGYDHLAYLAAKGVDSDDEIRLAQSVMKDSGKSLKDVVASKYFQAELKELRAEKASADALPSASKRSSSPAASTVEYWQAKGELPPNDQVELRRKVVNARLTKESSGSKFYNSGSKS